MKNKGLILIIVGTLFLLSAIGLVGYNLYEDYSASKTSKETVDKIFDYIEELKEGNDENSGNAEKPPESSPDNKDDDISEDSSFHPENTIPEYIQNPDIEMPSVLIDGEYYIGVLEIPSLKLSLPINSQWNYKRLKKTPCRYTGSAYKNNLVIAAHNYSSHFGNISDLEQGELVYFTDMNGHKFTYTVDVCETLIPQAVEEMTSGEWSLSLFTCTPGGANRVTLRCNALKD